MKHETKLLFKQLINNDACIEGGRTRPWWIAVIMALLSVVFAVLPISVSAIKTQGDSFIKSSQYGSEVGLVRFAEDLNNQEYDFVVKSNDEGAKYLDFTTAFTSPNITVKKDNKAVLYTHLDDESKVDFVVYGINEETTKEYSEFRSLIAANKVNPITGDPYDDSNCELQYQSFLLLGKYTCYMAIYKAGTTTAITATAGDYKAFEDNYSLKSLKTVLNSEGNVIDPTTCDAGAYKVYRDGCFANWKSFFRTAYKANRVTSIWTQTGLMCGVDVLLILFMGLMVFILTRGKRNPFRIYTFWECQKISYWTAFCPALLSLGLGFILSRFAIMIFVMLLGVRIMWMSMKSLRPQYQQ